MINNSDSHFSIPVPEGIPYEVGENSFGGLNLPRTPNSYPRTPCVKSQDQNNIGYFEIGLVIVVIVLLFSITLPIGFKVVDKASIAIEDYFFPSDEPLQQESLESSLVTNSSTVTEVELSGDEIVAVSE
ncbi:MAG: hypothetical protein DGJ47_000645 [Rickettsiaceae bacterium]